MNEKKPTFPNEIDEKPKRVTAYDLGWSMEDVEKARNQYGPLIDLWDDPSMDVYDFDVPDIDLIDGSGSGEE